MTTPILDYLNKYRTGGMSRLHMPGHKGHEYLGFESLDITEIKGADELYCCDGIIKESEDNVSLLFGTDHTCYSTEGSSHCIRTMIFLIRQHCRKDRPLILAARNAHKAFLYACAISDTEIEWIYPDIGSENSIASCQISASRLKTELEGLISQGRTPDAVYITSPDYLGQTADINKIAEICHEHGCILAVDNAHGAYLHFLNNSHPMDLGADICCDSAHKTLPVITGGAYLHVSDRIAGIDDIKAALEVTGTTSPSYLIMASLDKCNSFLFNDARQKFADAAAMTSRFKAIYKALGVEIIPSEDLKIVINAARLGFTGSQLGDILRKHMCEPEFCDRDYLVCMTAPDTEEKDLERLCDALKDALSQSKAPLDTTPLNAVVCPRRMTVREAVFAPHITIPVSEATGRICGAPCVSCPPAIPIVISGEVISDKAADIMKQYGIDTVSVVRD